MGAPLAHSAPFPGADPHLYADHVRGVVDGVRSRADAMLVHCRKRELATRIRDAAVDAAVFHDLGKLDPDVQTALSGGRGERLWWDHVDAGVAHLRARKACMAAWLVRAHHAPGLPSRATHFADEQSRQLRGRRRDDQATPAEHAAQIERTDALLRSMLERHEAAFGPHPPTPGKVSHGLPLRLALSCLVDADHADTALFDTQRPGASAASPRWRERLAALDAYVAKLDDTASARNELRRDFYVACRDSPVDSCLSACEGPVGVGKTTAVTAYLLRRAMATNARRLIVVAPYTAILSQTAERLRDALVLPDERARPEAVIVEHHHRADFADVSSREMAALWSAPIVLTTAVQFFETLAANEPATLRKLHALPGSACFVDEAHAALPTRLWSQNWSWLRELAEDWNASFVFASGSLARFWEDEDIVGKKAKKLDTLTDSHVSNRLLSAEASRIHYETRPLVAGPEALADAVLAETGPRLLIMNTVQSAAVMAGRLRGRGEDVLHLSTALSPQDRDAILRSVRARLGPNAGAPANWTLVATSLVEAGVDLSFRTAFRERFSLASLIQTGGRVNRHGELTTGGTVHDFEVEHQDGLTRHPDATGPAHVLRRFFERNLLQDGFDSAARVTRAMAEEIRGEAGTVGLSLTTAESAQDYPGVAELGRVINADTRTVVVDQALRDRLTRRLPVTHRDLLAGSVQLWAKDIRLLALPCLLPHRDLYEWPYSYDPDFLGYMAALMELKRVRDGRVLLI